MSADANSTPDVCPECGATKPLSRTKRSCWLCGHSFDGPSITTATAVPRASAVRQPQSFGLATLMLVVTLISVVMGLTALAPGLGILLIVLLTPAMVRTFGIVGRQKAKGRQVAAAHKIGTLFASLAVVTVIGSASVGAFLVTCFPIGLAAYGGKAGDNEARIFLAFIVGFGAAGIVGVFLIHKLWRTKEQ